MISYLFAAGFFLLGATSVYVLRRYDAAVARERLSTEEGPGQRVQEMGVAREKGDVVLQWQKFNGVWTLVTFQDLDRVEKLGRMLIDMAARARQWRAEQAKRAA